MNEERNGLYENMTMADFDKKIELKISEMSGRASIKLPF